MADSTLNIDWRTSVVGQYTNAASNNSSTSNDWYATAVTNSGTKWLNVAADSIIWRAESWNASIVYYKMRGMDQITNGLYATWVVTGAPDFSAAQYSGGLNLPLRDVTLVASWT